MSPGVNLRLILYTGPYKLVPGFHLFYFAYLGFIGDLETVLNVGYVYDMSIARYFTIVILTKKDF